MVSCKNESNVIFVFDFFFNHECEYMVGYDINGVIGMFYFYLLNQWNEIMVGRNGI